VAVSLMEDVMYQGSVPYVRSWAVTKNLAYYSTDWIRTNKSINVMVWSVVCSRDNSRVLNGSIMSQSYPGVKDMSTLTGERRECLSR
jgi:hypothetical protein